MNVSGDKTAVLTGAVAALRKGLSTRGLEKEAESLRAKGGEGCVRQRKFTCACCVVLGLF